MTPLHHFGQWLRELLGGIPLPLVRVLFVSLLVSVLIWALLLPRTATAPPGEGRWTSNLKLWAAVALAIQIVIYTFV